MHVQQNFPEAYPAWLTKGVVSKWPKQVAAARERAVCEQTRDRKKTGPVKFLGDLGEFAKEIRYRKATTLELVQAAGLIKTMHDAHVPLDVSIVRPLVEGALRANNNPWTPSTYWLRHFMLSMGYSFRRGTRDARSLPRNFAVIKEAHLTRWVWVIDHFKVHPDLIFNVDETGYNDMSFRH